MHSEVMLGRWSDRIQRVEDARRSAPVAVVTSYVRGRGFCESCQCMKPAPVHRKKGWACKDCREKKMSSRTEPTFTVSQSQYMKFLIHQRDNPNPGLRLGQAFFNFFDLGKMTSPQNKELADKLHAADGEVAKGLISSVLDFNN